MKALCCSRAPFAILRAALLSAAINLAWSLPAIWLVMDRLGEYGWLLFVAIPFLLGFVASVTVTGDDTCKGTHAPGHGPEFERGLSRMARSVTWRAILASLLAALFSLLAVAGALLAFRWEGLICLLLASPLVLLLSLLGALAGYWMRRMCRGSISRRLGALAILCLPAFMSMNSRFGSPEPIHEAVTVVEIDAPPEIVWRQVVADRTIRPPSDWYFKTGLGVPRRASMRGTGVGTVRYCRFSTGTAVEPITVWDENRRLAFDVTQSAPPMEEFNPFGKVDAPHLHGYLVATGGEFRLVPLPGGRTRLERSTWYRHGLRPAIYWTRWTDLVIDRIHRCIMRQIKEDAERETAAQRPANSRASTS